MPTDASSYESLATHLSPAGADFEVIEPVELADEVHRLAERYQGAAELSNVVHRQQK